jgi:hypothetical protein
MRYRVTSLAKVQEDLSPPDANGAGHISRCLKRCQPISRAVFWIVRRHASDT